MAFPLNPTEGATHVEGSTTYIFTSYGVWQRQAPATGGDGSTTAETLPGTNLAPTVTGSNLTKVGMISQGTWQGTPIASEYVAQVASAGVVFVGKHGSDAKNGLSVEKAKLTIASAVAWIETQAPAEDNRFVIHVVDGGLYAEDIDLPASVSLFAPNAVIAGRVSMNDDSKAIIHRHFAGNLAEVVRKVGGNKTSFYRSNVTDTRGLNGLLTGKQGCENLGAGTGQLFVDIKKLYVGTGSEGIGSSTNGTNHIHFNIEDLYLAGDNAQGIVYNGASNVVGYIHHLLEIDAPAATVGINVISGEVCVTLNELRADTTYQVDASGTLRMFVNKLVGTRGTVDGVEQVFALDSNIQSSAVAAGHSFFGSDDNGNIRKYDAEALNKQVSKHLFGDALNVITHNVDGPLTLDANNGRSQVVAMGANIADLQFPTNLPDGETMLMILVRLDSASTFNYNALFRTMGSGTAEDITALANSKIAWINIVRADTAYGIAITTEQ